MNQPQPQQEQPAHLPLVRGVLTYFVPVEFRPNPDDDRTPEDQFVAWAMRKKIVVDGETYLPGNANAVVSADDEEGTVAVPADGIFITE